MMEIQENNEIAQDYFEYHGNTIVEMIRREAGYTIKRDWILFDTVEEAQAFFNENQIFSQ